MLGEKVANYTNLLWICKYAERQSSNRIWPSNWGVSTPRANGSQKTARGRALLPISGHYVVKIV